MKRWIKIILIIAVIFAGALFLSSLKKGRPTSSSSKPPETNNPAGVSDQSGFELKKSNAYYAVYYHTGDGENADKTLDVLAQAVDDIYKKYYGLIPQNTPVYLAATINEYVKIADFPGGAANVRVGDGSAPNGKIYLYKPFDDPEKGGGVIVHEGTHAVLYDAGFLGGQNAQLPGFLNEGLAYNAEFIHKGGANYKPLREIYYADLLRRAALGGGPALMSLQGLGENCEGYIGDQVRNGLCRGQGTFVVWYMAKNYGQDFWSRFLADLKTSGSWQKSLEVLADKTLSQLGQEIDEALKSQAK